MMTYYYRLEIWVPLEAYRDVCKLFDIEPLSEPRSIVSLFQQRLASPPEASQINTHLDQVELHLPALEDLGIRRRDISLWIECEQNQASEIYLDAITLQRLGQEGIKLCISCWEKRSDVEGKDRVMTKEVDIDEVWIEAEANAHLGTLFENMIYQGSSEVLVRFDDETAWRAHFITFDKLQEINMRAQKNGSFLHGSFYWGENTMIVEATTRDCIESVILELLRQGNFEKAFGQVEGEPSLLPSNSYVRTELNIIHNGNLPVGIEDILGVPKLDIEHAPNFWKYGVNSSTPENASTKIGNLLEMIAPHKEVLSAMEIRKQDMHIKWEHQYENQCNLEFGPDILSGLGSAGMGFLVLCRVPTEKIVRQLVA